MINIDTIVLERMTLYYECLIHKYELDKYTSVNVYEALGDAQEGIVTRFHSEIFSSETDPVNVKVPRNWIDHFIKDVVVPYFPGLIADIILHWHPIKYTVHSVKWTERYPELTRLNAGRLPELKIHYTVDGLQKGNAC